MLIFTQGPSGWLASPVNHLHFGLILPNYGDALSPERLVVSARAAERAGFDSGWVTDHLLVPTKYASTYGTITEALVTVAFLAGKTEHLELGVSALVIPQRNPYVVLKQIVSLDYLSGGRIVMAVAAGWIQAEFSTLGAPFDGRGKLLDEWLALARAIFDQPAGPITHIGGLPLEDAWLAPGSARSGGPELWVAGVSQVTIARATKTGIWHPVALPPARLATMAADFRRRRTDGRVILRINAHFSPEPDRGGTDERGRHAITGPSEWLAERLDEYVEVGCDGFVLNLGHDTPALDERVQRFAEEVRPLLHSTFPPAA